MSFSFWGFFLGWVVMLEVKSDIMSMEILFFSSFLMVSIIAPIQS